MNSFIQYFSMNNIFAITAVVLVVAIIFFVAYYFIYRFFINKKILKGDRTAHTAIVSPAVVMVTIGVILCVAAYFINQYQMQIVIMQGSDIYSTAASNTDILIREIVKNKAERIAKNYSFESGSVHNDTKTYDLKLTIETDIALGKNDKLTFRIGDSKSELKKTNDGNYSCTVQASILKENHQGILTLESDGDRISEILNDACQIIDGEIEEGTDNEIEINDCFPYIDSSEANFVLTEKDENTSEMSVDMTVTAYPSKADEKDNFTEMKLIFEQEGKILSETDLMNSKDVKKNGNDYTYSFKGTISNGENPTCYVLAKDKNGFGYKLYCGLNFGEFDNNNDNIIYDQDGNFAAVYYYDL